METPSSEMSDPFYSPDPATRVAADSQESALSIAERDDSWQLRHESALPQLQAVLADTQQYNNTMTQIDIALLDKAIKEIIELNNKVKIFSQKYTGAKVSVFLAFCVDTDATA
jgi:spermidine/putrescine-binding protein